MMTLSSFKRSVLSALLLVSAVSCVKEKEQVVPSSERTIYASIRQVEPEVKTTLFETAKVYWTSGDAIRVYNADFSAFSPATAQSSGASTQFTLDAAVSGGSFCAVYPASATSPAGGDAFAASVTAPSDGYTLKTRNIIFSTQRAIADGFDPLSTPMAAIKGADGNFTFVNYASLLKFTLSGAGIASVVVEGNKGTAVLAGSFLVDGKDADSDGILDTFQVTDDPSPVDVSTSVTLLPPDGESVFAPGTYYVAVRPDVTVSGGVRLTSYDAAGNPMRTLANNSNVTLNRGKIRSLGSLAAGSDLERIQACDMVDAATQLSTRTLAPGIQQTDYQVTWAVNGDLPSVVSLMHVIRFDRQKATAAGAKIRTLTAYNGVGVVYDGTDNDVRQSVRNMLLCADTKDEKVIMGTSGSYNNSGVPNGYMVKDGVSLYDPGTSNSRPVVAVKADNTMYMGYQSNWATWTDEKKADYPNVNDGYVLSVNNGAINMSGGKPRAANTARYGICAEGYTVRGSANGDIYFVTVDPANYGNNTSHGATFLEVAHVMQSLGCNRAAYAQSGTTVAMWTRNPETHVLEGLGDGNFASEPISVWGITIPAESYTTVTDAINGSSMVKAVNSSSETTIKPGCTYTQLSLTMAQGYNTESNLSGDELGDKLNIWVLRVDPVQAGLSLKVLMAGDNYTASATSFSGARLDDMAKAYMTHNSKQPRVILNGDFADVEGGYIPRSPVHARGVAVKTTYYDGTDKPQQGQSFVGIKADKSIYIGDKSEYASSLVSTYPELCGAGLMFLKDGRLNASYIAPTGHMAGYETTIIGKYNWPGTTQPRTAIGYDENGVIYVIWADGRHTNVSKGASYVELCELFKSLGCTRAANLDGGGSTQFVKWVSGTSYSTLNEPRSLIDETPVPWREVATGLAFIED